MSAGEGRTRRGSGTSAGARTRRIARRLLTALAFAVVWLTLVMPDRLDRLTPTAFARIPTEGLVLVAIALLLPSRGRRIAAVLIGLLLSVLTVVKVLDMGFYAELDRPFDPVIDWSNFGPAIGVVRDSVGSSWTDVLEIAAVLALVAVVAIVTWSVARVSAVAARNRTNSIRGVAALAVVSAACTVLTIQLTPGMSITSAATAALAVDQVREARDSVLDERRFQTALRAPDPFAATPAADLLTGLRGKDVIVAFVESYGEVAVQGTTFSPGVDAVLRSGTRTLGSAGYETKSAFLTSPTFGGISWLAHSTLQSGLWVDNQQRYNKLVSSDRFTLSDAFGKAGWRTVGDVPSDTGPWPQGKSFYHYDKLYNRHNVGYRGPKFSYAAMPDQYTLAAFERAELAPGHAPVMAEIDLVSSHTPWTPLPHMVAWNQVGDGSVYDPMPAQGLAPHVAWQQTATVRALYGQSVEYSLDALISWITTIHDDNLVLVLLGDHQPATIVSGAGANHDVPITIVAHDPAVMDRIESWNWQAGMLPGRAAPVWPMDAFRDRFLTAFDAPPPATPAAAQPAH